MAQDKVARIRELNDAFRKSPWNDARALGRTVLTEGVHARGPEFQLKVLDAVAGFDDFNEGNDPHKEGDFGKVVVDDVEMFFKIDYFDTDGIYGSEDPSDPKQTTRVMTIMLSSEY